MAGLTLQHVEDIINACRKSAGALAFSLNACVDTDLELTPGEPQQGTTPDGPPELNGPGLWLVLSVGSTGLGIAIPDALGLPAWCPRPEPEDQERLDTLALEWSFKLLPKDLPADQHSCRFVDNLQVAVALSQPDPVGLLLPIQAQNSATGSGATLWVVAPLTNVGQPDEAVPEDAPSRGPASRPCQDEIVRRVPVIKKLPVAVIVKLAEKKITLSQLRAVGPGTIVQFEKSCEDLLDLCVNNAVYCRGEAVKIGEKFGLKINALGPFEDLLDPLGGKGDRVL